MAFIIYVIGTYKMIGNRFLEKERVGLRVGVTVLTSFLINISFLVFYVNIQPSCPKTRMEYFNIKIRLLVRET